MDAATTEKTEIVDVIMEMFERFRIGEPVATPDMAIAAKFNNFLFNCEVEHVFQVKYGQNREKLWAYVPKKRDIRR